MLNIQRNHIDRLRSSNDNLHHIEGGDFKGLLLNPISHTRALRKGIRKDYSPPVYRFIRENYNDEIVGIEVFRRPLASAINKALNWISLGKWDKEKKIYGYDTFYHLGMIATMKSGKRIVIEKNAVINVMKAPALHNINRKLGGERINIPIVNPIKLGVFLDRTEKQMGSNYFLYDPFKNNCQVFVLNVLRANGLLNDEQKKFILQDIEGVVSAQKSYVPKVAQKITDLGGLADTFYEGETNREKIGDIIDTEDREKPLENETVGGSLRLRQLRKNRRIMNYHI